MKCFVTFSEDDAGRAHVELLIQKLKEITGDRIEFLVFYKEDFGDSLDDYMLENLKSCDCVLGLFGPEYKKRIDNSVRYSGAFIEYDVLISRLNDKIPGPKPRLVPVHWAGSNITEAVPGLIMGPNPFVADLSAFRASGLVIDEPFLPEKLADRYETTLRGVARSLLLQESIASTTAKRQHTITLQKLLLNRSEDDIDDNLDIGEVLKFKYEEGAYTTNGFREHLFTKTRFFRHLQNRNVGLISGRKGSGKTTLVQIQEYEASLEDCFPVIDISVNNWKLHMLIQNQTFRQAQSDFEYVDLEVNFFDFVWPIFVALCLTASVLFDRRERGKPVASGQVVSEEFVGRQLDRLISDCSVFRKFRFDSLFEISVISARKYMQSVVDRSSSESEEKFRLDVLGSLSIRGALFELFGQDMARLFAAIDGAQNSTTSRKFVFGFDRFDTEIQKYRQFDLHMADVERNERAAREVAWLSSLTKFVNKTRSYDRSDPQEEFYKYFAKIRFLVVLPYDRVREILDSQRDSITSEVIEEIHWQPKELLTMLRKRIQTLYNIDDREIDKVHNPTPEQRFKKCLSAGRVPLPEKSHIQLGTLRIEMDLFLYILRHSLFRPRDILIHYAAIIGHVESVRGKGERDLRESIREIVSREAQRIVSEEFIGELRDTWTNIEDILALFMGQNQVLSSRDVEAIIGSRDFDFYYEAAGLSDFGQKVEFLYDIGFLGYRSTRASAAEKQRTFTFSFFGGAQRLPFQSKNVMRTIEFAVHPIFVEHLFLGINPRQPVLAFNWEELNKIDRIS